MRIDVFVSQTKKLKVEKDIQKAKAKKSRDSYLLMLAENVDIDARTRWRDAIELLQNDMRYKNVDDPREREELFNDFVSELEKKEREDRNRQKEIALQSFRHTLQTKGDIGELDRKSVWSDAKVLFGEISKDAQLRVLDEADLRRAFQDFKDELEALHKQQKKEKREKLQCVVDGHLRAFKSLLGRLVREGAFTVDIRWKEALQIPDIRDHEALKELVKIFTDDSSISASALGVTGDPRETFEKIQGALRGKIGVL